MVLASAMFMYRRSAARAYIPAGQSGKVKSTDGKVSNGSRASLTVDYEVSHSLTRGLRKDEQ